MDKLGYLKTIVNKFLFALSICCLTSLYGYSQSKTTVIQSKETSTWKPVITIRNPTKTTTTRSTVRKNNNDIKEYGNEDIIVRRKSVTYDPQYNMCVTLEITNNSSNKKVIAIQARIHYSSSELKSVDAEDVTAEVIVEPEESNWAFLFGNPKPTYKFMMMGRIIIYFSDGTTQEIS